MIAYTHIQYNIIFHIIVWELRRQVAADGPALDGTIV